MKKLLRDFVQCTLLTTAVALNLFSAPRAGADTNQLAVFTFAGSTGTNGGTDGVGSEAGFYFPSGIAVDGAGNLFVADSSNDTIRKITPAGRVVTIAGFPGHSGTNDGIGSVALFNNPNAVALDSTGNVYVADSGNNTIRGIGFDGTNWVVSTLAGMPGKTGTNDDVGSAARFSNPKAVTVDPSGIVYVADANNNTIRKMILSGGSWTVSTLAGKAGVSGSANGSGGIARFNSPRYLATDAGGNIYVADWFNYTVRKVTPAGSVSTLAGLAGSHGTNDGVGSAARFYTPRGVAVDGATNVYVADYYNCTVRKITPAGNVTTLAGHTGTPGGANGTGTNAFFNNPCAVISDSAGQTFFIADTSNHSIRKAYYDTGKPIISTEPQRLTVLLGSNITFTVFAAGLGVPGYQWRFGGTNVTDATNASLTISNAQFSDAGDYGVIATNIFGATTNPVVVLDVVSLLITAQPQNLAVVLGTNASFSVGVAGLGPINYRWLFDGADLPGATNVLVSLTNVLAANAGFYQVIVTNAYESATSSVATLSILGVPVFLGVDPKNSPYSNGQFHFQALGSTGQGQMVVSASTNLAAWIPIYTNPSSFGTVQLVDPVASNYPARFYRATTPSAP